MTLSNALSYGFLGYVGLLALVISLVVWRSLVPRAAAVGVVVLAAWLGYAGLLGYLGVVRSKVFGVPGAFVLVLPIFVFIAIVIGRSRVGQTLASRIALQWLIGLQLFRVGVEFTLHKLWEAGLVPTLMTLQGGNVEIVVALAAPVVALIASHSGRGRVTALLWNGIGVISLANVVARAVLTSPGPLHVLASDVPNLASGLFPFTFIPGFMVPLALALHVLTFRALAQSAPIERHAAAAT